MKRLLTGGSGLLGTELRSLIPGIMIPTSIEMNLTDAAQVMAAVECARPDGIIHDAAFTDMGSVKKTVRPAGHSPEITGSTLWTWRRNIRAYTNSRSAENRMSANDLEPRRR